MSLSAIGADVVGDGCDVRSHDWMRCLLAAPKFRKNQPPSQKRLMPNQHLKKNLLSLIFSA